MKRIFTSCLVLLFILMISSCAGAYNDYKEKNTGSVSFNVGQIAQKALSANRSISREGEPIEEESENPDGENNYIEPWDCISSAVLKINVETKGDYKTSIANDFDFDYSRYISEGNDYLKEWCRDKIIELEIPVGKTITIDMKVNLEISWDEDMLEQVYNQMIEEMINNDASEEEIAKYTFALFKESLDLQFNGEMGIRLKGTSEEITIHEGENPVTITLKEVPYSGGEERERKYYLIYLQSEDAATVTYEEPFQFECMSIDEEGARLKAICYYYEPYGYFKNDEKSDQDWKEDDFGNLYMDIYFDYNEEAKKDPLYQTVGFDNTENRYIITLYSAKNQTDSGIYRIDNSDGLQVSYGEWKDISGTDAKIPSFEFTETLYLNNDTGLSFANEKTLTYSDMSDGFIFISANGNEIAFRQLEPFNGEGNGGIEGTGTINPVLPNQFRISIDSDEETYYLNKGIINFILTDSNGQEIDVSNVVWEYEISHGKTTIPDDGNYYTYENPGVLKLVNLPAGGTYQLNVLVTPENPDYENYEIANAVFNITVDDKFLIDFDILECYDAENMFTPDFQELVASHNAKIILKGGIDEAYETFFAKLNAVIYNSNNSVYNLYDLDLSQVTTTSTSIEEQGYFRGCSALRSIIFPEDFTTVNNFSFDMCNNLETIEFTSESIIIGTGTFSECTKLSSVIIPEKAQLIVIDSLAFEDDTALTSLELQGASVIAIGYMAFGNIELSLPDENGTWYYVPDGESEFLETWMAWWANPDEADPENDAEGSFTKDDDEIIGESLAEKIIYAVNELNYHLFWKK